MPHMSQEDWSRAVAAMGPKEAEKWRSTRNIFVDELPPPPYTGPLSTGGSAGVRPTPVTAAAPSATVAPTQGPPKVDETDSTPDLSAFGGLGYGLDPSQLSGPNSGKIIQQMMQQQRFDQSLQNASAAQQQAEAQKRIDARYAGPTQSDMLMALSQAMLSPRKVPGFGGFMGSLMGTFGDISAAGRKAQQDREDAMEELKQQYTASAAARQGAGQKTMMDLLHTYGALNKPKSLPSVIINEQKAFEPATGALITQPSNEAIADLSANPTSRNLQKFIETFGPRFADQARQIVARATGGMQ